MKQYFPLLLLSSFLLRLLITGTSLSEAIALTSLCALYSIHHYIESKREAPINEEFKLKVSGLERQMSDINNNLKAVREVSIKKPQSSSMKF